MFVNKEEYKLIRIVVDRPEELLWLHEVISTGTINMSQSGIAYLEQNKVPLKHEVTYVKSDAYIENHEKYLKELEDNGK